MEEAKKGVVCVTGGTGYVGSWLIMRLLQHGYSVTPPLGAVQCYFGGKVLATKYEIESSFDLWLRLKGESRDMMESFESTIGLVHVDDVANAHIFLFENPNAKGRYICCSTTIVPAKLLEFLANRHPQYKIPIVDESNITRRFKYPRLSSQKLLDVGFKFKYGLEEIYDDAVECCKQRGFL